MILGGFVLAEIAIDATAGSIEDPVCAASPHCLNDIIGQHRALVKVDFRLARRAGNVRIRREMNYHLVPAHRRGQAGAIADVPAHYAKTRIADMRFVVPFASGSEVVVERNRGNFAVRQQSVGEVASDETGAPDYEITIGHMISRESDRSVCGSDWH